MNLSDIFHFSHPHDKSFSFFSKAHNTQSRIDRIYGSRILCDSAVQTDFLEVPISDHKIFSAKIRLNFVDLNFGKSYWKINSEIFKRKNVILMDLESDFSTFIYEPEFSDDIFKDWENF